MITIIICSIIGIVLGMCLIWDIYFLEDSIALKIILTIFMIFISGSFGALLGIMIPGAIIGNILPTKYVIEEEKQIVAMKDQSTTTGSFFLGTGTVDNEYKYVYYVKNKDNSIRLETIPTSGVKVFQDEDKNPRVIIFRKTFKDEKYWLYGCISDDKLIEIHIPKGSVLNMFELDLK